MNLFYEVNENDAVQFKCKICKKYKCGKNTSNLVAHIKTSHNDTFRQHFKPSEAEFQRLKLKRLSLLQSFVEIVTVNMRPFTALSDSGFLKAINNTLIELQQADLGFHTSDRNHHEIKEYIAQVAAEIREKIKEEVKGKFLALMMDIGEKYGHSVLGLTITFFIDEVLTERNVGIMDFSKQHNRENIVDDILRCFQRFEINPHQLIAITSDNARNMRAAIKRFDILLETGAIADKIKEIQKDNEPDNSLTPPPNEDMLHDPNITREFSCVEIQAIRMQLDEEERFIPVLDNTTEEEDLMRSVVSDLSSRTTAIFDIRCAAHTLQLVVRDAFKDLLLDLLLKAVKSLVKGLHKQTFINEAKANNILYHIPRLSCNTRWDTEYFMVSVEREYEV